MLMVHEHTAFKTCPQRDSLLLPLGRPPKCPCQTCFEVLSLAGETPVCTSATPQQPYAEETGEEGEKEFKETIQQNDNEDLEPE